MIKNITVNIGLDYLKEKYKNNPLVDEQKNKITFNKHLFQDYRVESWLHTIDFLLENKSEQLIDPVFESLLKLMKYKIPVISYEDFLFIIRESILMRNGNLFNQELSFFLKNFKFFNENLCRKIIHLGFAYLSSFKNIYVEKNGNAKHLVKRALVFLNRELSEYHQETVLETIELWIQKQISFDKSTLQNKRIVLTKSFLKETRNKNKFESNFCSLAFIGMCVEAGGRFKPCCKYKKWNDTFNINEVGLQKAIEDKQFSQIRKDMLNNVKHEGCQRCWEDESVGVTSLRQSSNKLFSHHVEIEKPKVKFIDFGFGNSCNAACIMCESSSSHMWSEEDKILSEEHKEFERFYFPKIKDSITFTKSDYEDIVHIRHAQNEVLASPEFKKFLIKLDENSDVHEKTILISTNGSIWPQEEVLNILKKFKNCKIQISIDGLGEHNEYIRYPLKWDKVESVVKKWLLYGEFFQITARCTISIYNILYLEKLKMWWKDLSGNRRMSFGYCWFPQYLSPMIYSKTLKPHIDGKQEEIPELVKFLEGDKDEENLQKLFWSFTKKMDNFRNMNITESFPELAELLNAEDNYK